MSSSTIGQLILLYVSLADIKSVRTFVAERCFYIGRPSRRVSYESLQLLLLPHLWGFFVSFRPRRNFTTSRPLAIRPGCSPFPISFHRSIPTVVLCYEPCTDRLSAVFSIKYRCIPPALSLIPYFSSSFLNLASHTHVVQLLQFIRYPLLFPIFPVGYISP